MTNNSDNRVIFDINIPVAENDLDIFELFLSNKNQAGPNGDLISCELDEATRKQITVVYEFPAAAQTVLTKRFFTLKSYFLRSSTNGFLKETYDINKRQIIIKNIENDPENLKVELYAEYLMPDNSVSSIAKSQFQNKTFLITYNEDIDFKIIEQRYLKKQESKNAKSFEKIEYLKSMKTSTIIIRSRSKKQTTDSIMKKLTTDIYSKLGDKPNIFLSQGINFVLCQFKSELDTDQFLKSIQEYLEENRLVCEYCSNLALIKDGLYQTNNVKIDKPTQTETVNHKVSNNGSITTNSHEVKTGPVEHNNNDAMKANSSANYDEVYQCFNDALKGISIKESTPKHSVQLNLKTNPVLVTTLVRCSKVLQDFKQDLEQRVPSCKLSIKPDQAHFNIIFKQNDFESVVVKNNVVNLVLGYEDVKLRYERIYLKDLFDKNDKNQILTIDPAILLNFFKKSYFKKELDILKSKLNIYFKSTKCLFVQYDRENKFFECYGYAQAVVCFNDQLDLIVTKNVKQMEHKALDKLNFNLSLAQDYRLGVFFKLSDLYFKKFQSQLADLKAKINVRKDNVLNIFCSDNIEKTVTKVYIEKVNIWRNSIEDVIQRYLSQVESLTIDLNFQRSSEKANQILYDKNSVSILWTSDTAVKVFGVKDRIKDFQRAIATASNL